MYVLCRFNIDLIYLINLKMIYRNKFNMAAEFILDVYTGLEQFTLYKPLLQTDIVLQTDIGSTIN